MIKHLSDTNEIRSFDFSKQNNSEQDIYIISIKERLSNKSVDFTKRHILNFYAIILITEGNYQHELEFETFDLQVGDLIIICPNQIHKFLQVTDIDGLIIVFSEEFINNYLLKSNGLLRLEMINRMYDLRKLSLTDFTFNQIKNIAHILDNELKHPIDLSQQMICQHLLVSIIVNIDREIKLTEDPIKFDNHTTIVMQFKYLLNKSVLHSNDVQYYAEQLNINKRTLQIATKEILGKTPRELINQQLLIASKRQLLELNNQIQDVAFNLGFSDSTTFSKFFKKNTSLTPQEFKNKIHEL